MTKPTRYPEFAVNGAPKQLGQQIGEATREQIRGFCEVAYERVCKTVQISRDRAFDIARGSLRFAREYRPDLVEELQGTAEAAGVTLDDLMLLQVRNQLQSEKSGGCTSMSFFPETGIRSGPVVAQTWDNDPVLDEFTVVLTRYPDGKPSFTSCTQAGLISYMGFSETGIATCVNTLPAPSRDTGVPHYFMLREIYEANSLDEAVQSVYRAHRAIPVNIMMSTPEGPANLEVTLDGIRALKPRDSSVVTHTNHCVHEDFKPINNDFPELAQSYSRKTRIDELLKGRDRRADRERIKNILSDHDNYPGSICRHPGDDPVTGFWETVFAIIIEPDERRMWVTRGNPCDHSFEEYGMKRV
ncbi:MAG: C45 family peptidase [Fuerstiella sp.]|nr:C45 family peptidase [Fuerstiella sp.]